MVRRRERRYVVERRDLERLRLDGRGLDRHVVRHQDLGLGQLGGQLGGHQLGRADLERAHLERRGLGRPHMERSDLVRSDLERPNVEWRVLVRLHLAVAGIPARMGRARSAWRLHVRGKGL